ncbi:MAG: hypothetical protein HY516_01360 [Candidatus Aenigmarchaeota archaeon]|nr:hypothetical protein [Candidatus Aenigmarchaeota archaeon]
MKAVTPVIALVMLLLITTGLVGASYFWFGSVLSSQTTNAISIPAGGAYCSNGNIRVYVLNSGSINISAADVVVGEVDGISVINNGLVVYWKFDEGAGPTASDSSGSGNNGNIAGSPVWESGRTGKALRFDGSLGNYVIKNPLPGFPSSEITAAFWMKSTDTTTSGAPVSYASPSSDNDFLIFNYQSFDIYAIGNNVNTGVKPNDGNWHHIAATWKSAGGEARMYKDSAPAFSGTVSSGVAITNGGSLVIAQEQDSVGDAFQSSQSFIGTIDEVRIYNRVLSASEIKFIYGIKPGESALAIDYPAAPGKHVVRIGTPSGIAETSVYCA